LVVQFLSGVSGRRDAALYVRPEARRYDKPAVFNCAKADCNEKMKFDLIDFDFTMTQTLEKKAGDLTVTEPFLEKFRHFESGAEIITAAVPQGGPRALAELGFPTLQNEDWRFTNVAPLAKLPFAPMFEAPAVNGAETKAPERIRLRQTSGHAAGVCERHYSPKLSTVEKLPAGVKVGSLAAALTSDAMLVEKYLGRCAPCRTTPSPH